MAHKEMTPGNLKTAMAAAGASRPNGWAIDPHKIVVRKGYNVRSDTEANRAKIRWLADQMKEHGFNRKFPLGVTIIKEGNKDLVMLDAGHRRHAAALLAISEGADLGMIPVVTSPAGTNEETLTVELITSNEGDPLTPYERAEVMARLAKFGRTSKEIAQLLGLASAQHVDDQLMLIGAPLPLRRMVMEGATSITTAVKAVKQHGDGAMDVMVKALAASPKGKVTAGKLADPKAKAVRKQAPEMLAALKAVRKDPAYLALDMGVRGIVDALCKVKA